MSVRTRSGTIIIGVLLLLLAITEVSTQLYWIHHNPAVPMSWLYLAVGLVIGCLAMRAPQKVIPAPGPRLRGWILAGLLAGIIWIVAFCAGRVADIVAAERIDYHIADMLPVIKVMNERLLAGQPVYDMIPQIWGGIQPVYLPAMWLPYSAAVAGGYDLRWAALAVFLAGLIAVILAPLRRRKYPVACLVIFPLILVTWLDGAVRLGDPLFTVSEEGVVVGYLALLCAAIYRRSGIATGLCLALCLLSRMNIAPWALMFGIVLLIRDRKEGLKAGLTCAGVCILLMGFTGAWNHLDVFLNLPDQYLKNIQASPAVLTNVIRENVGLAKLFFPKDMASLHAGMKWAAFGVPLVCVIAMRPWRKKVDLRFFALGSLKLSLVAFYNLLLIPYEYLFHASLIVTIAILFCWLGSAQKNDVEFAADSSK